MCIIWTKKYPTGLEKISENLRGDFFDSHCINYIDLLLRSVKTVLINDRYDDV